MQRCEDFGAGVVVLPVDGHPGRLANAFKHGFPGERRGAIHVTMLPEAGAIDGTNSKKYRLVVRDTGVGMPEALDTRHTRTLGLQLVASLVNQLSGRLEFDRTSGTTVTIRFRDHLSLGMPHAA